MFQVELDLCQIGNFDFARISPAWAFAFRNRYIDQQQDKS